MCSPSSNGSCHTKTNNATTTRHAAHQSPNTIDTTRRQQQQQLIREGIPSTTNSASPRDANATTDSDSVDSIMKQHDEGEVSTTETKKQHPKISSHLLYKRNSPTTCGMDDPEDAGGGIDGRMTNHEDSSNSVRRSNSSQGATPNTTPQSKILQNHNTHHHNNTEGFTIHKNMSYSNTMRRSAERREHHSSFSPSSNELVRNPKLPPPLLLSPHSHYDQGSPSPRDVTQDRHLYRSSPRSHHSQHPHQPHGTYHSHNSPRMDYPPVPLWPHHQHPPTHATFGSSRSPHVGETRQESSPMSSASNSSSVVSGGTEWSGGGKRDQSYSSPLIMHSPPQQSQQHQQQQPYMSPPMYRQPPPQVRTRIPFHLKPRPDQLNNNNNTTYRPPHQKQYSGHYTPYWAGSPPQPQATSPYRPNNTPTSNTPPHHTHTRHPPSPLSSLPTPTTPTTKNLLTPTNNTLTPSPTRTSPEILKTLLRKKACLYEPGTSRAITLLTWIVARSLALKHGYFSRQHLQSGVHAIVADKITKGVITRTKVNRCMQVILNSCFYYIIPKPDGTEESGESFRRVFGTTVEDDTALIRTLPEPWNDLVWREEATDALELECGVGSPPPQGGGEEEEGSSSPFCSKRQVLLCFNENVRCAEDVLRCHNDFIRDSAISANLVLTPEEWRDFYLNKDDGKTTALTAPLRMKKGPVADRIYNSYMSFDVPADVEKSLACKENIQSVQSGVGGDALGQMTTSELKQFRTTWCCKRYDHDATLCRFAHIDVNKGWLRRDPSQTEYSVTLCPKTKILHHKTSNLDGCYVNACADGLCCKLAHSQEEVEYHPKNYKATVCESSRKGSTRACDMRDICPNLHTGGHSGCCATTTPPRPLARHSGRRNINDTHIRIKGHLISGKYHTPSIGSTDVGSSVRTGAPMLYLGTAPSSEFDKTLHFPGLCSLYRRNCATYYANDVGGGSEEMEYSNFGGAIEAKPTNLSLPSVAKSVASKDHFSLFGVV